MWVEPNSRWYKNRKNAKSLICYVVYKSTILTLSDNSHKERRANHTLNREFIEKNFSEDHVFHLNVICIHKSYETQKKYVRCHVLDVGYYTLLDVRHEDMIKLPLVTHVTVVT